MKVLYLYDNLPSYRKDFFELLSFKLSENSDEFLLGYGFKSDSKSDSKQLRQTNFNSRPLELSIIKTPFFQFIRLKQIKKLFNDYKPDVIILQFHVAVLSYWWMYFYAKRHKIPYITWDCNYTRDSLKSFLVRIRKKIVDFTYKQANVCITYGSFFKEYLIQLGINPNNIVVAQNTINVEKLYHNRSIRCKNRVFDTTAKFLYVGALIQRKYVLSAVKATHQLVDEGYKLHFDIVGNGDEYNKISDYINQHNLTSVITLHGAKHGDDVKYFFENNDVFVLPGTGGLAINEAMAYSMPIISTMGDDTILDLIDGNGFLLDKMGDVEEIKNAMKKFMLLSDNEKILMAQKSEAIVLNKASLKNMVNRHIDAINIVKFNFSKT